MTKVLQLSKKQLEQMKSFYRDQLKEPLNEYVFFAVKDMSITAYTSGKVVFQGNKAIPEYDYWIEIFGMVDEIIKKDLVFYTPSIGSDEVGKGDYFGPLVVCACYVSKDAMNLVRDLNIADSKARSDERIVKVAKKIKDHVVYSVLVLTNQKYNELMAKGFSSVKMMAILHNQAIYNVQQKIKNNVDAIVDQFAEPGVFYHYIKQEPKKAYNLKFTTKAESKHASVAVASILARYKFLDEMKKLSDEVGFELPKGAGEQVDKVIQQIILEKDESVLNKIAKISHNNTKKAKEMLGL